MAKLWLEQIGEGPLLATAIHAGHELRSELLSLLSLGPFERSHEEDPYSDYWAMAMPSWLVPTRSRFEVDLNRDRDEAVYLNPDMAWGLRLWKTPPTSRMIEQSLAEYDAVYGRLKIILDRMAAHHRRIVVFDLHAYNHRRSGPDAHPAPAATDPEVNIGTGTMNRALWGPVVDRFIDDLRRFDFLGRRLDVRENVKFQGRHLAQWVHETYPGVACVIAVEFKKFFMDEWTGVGDIEQIRAIRVALQSTLPGVLKELERLK